MDPALVDFTALARWMDDQGLPPGDFTEVAELTGGTQNVMLRLCRGDQVYVLRRPPPARARHRPAHPSPISDMNPGWSAIP
ncbi:hypothetical protein [Saccharopolyspora shandongensis]|uniref:hypothetical protein n=1 Tax=Saccharopolyspora shandongensis TaxID=418495 RepID=UPI0033E228B3